jgi:putative phosphotransacetylase
MLIHPRFIVDRSANHCHLTQQHAEIIIGKALDKMILRPLAIEGEYATNFKVYSQYDSKGYTLMYPFREYSQIEVAMSDYYKIFRKYTTRVSSGDTKYATKIRVVGNVDIPIIVVKPHVHLHKFSDCQKINDLNFPFELDIKSDCKTIDGLNHIHLDTDQYAAII